MNFSIQDVDINFECIRPVEQERYSYIEFVFTVDALLSASKLKTLKKKEDFFRFTEFHVLDQLRRASHISSLEQQLLNCFNCREEDYTPGSLKAFFSLECSAYKNQNGLYELKVIHLCYGDHSRMPAHNFEELIAFYIRNYTIKNITV
jgi:hypothetical protein